MKSLRSRLERLEAVDGPTEEKPFLWMPEVSLADALAEKGWTLDDGPFLAIEMVLVEPSPDGPRQISDPIHDRDRHLLGV